MCGVTRILLNVRHLGKCRSYCHAVNTRHDGVIQAVLSTREGNFIIFKSKLTLVAIFALAQKHRHHRYPSLASPSLHAPLLYDLEPCIRAKARSASRLIKSQHSPMPLMYDRKHCKLHRPAKRGDLHLVQAIVDSAPDAHALTLLLESTDKGKTPLLRACKYGHHEVVVALLRAGANLRAIDSSKRSCLHLAVAHGHVEVTRTLLSSGAMPLLEQVDGSGKRPLDLHPARNQADIQRVLHQPNTPRHAVNNDLVDVQTSVPMAHFSIPASRRSMHRDRRNLAWNAGSGGAFVPTTAAPLLPCMLYTSQVG